MSICDRCIHDEVCGLEYNHEEGLTFCADIMMKDTFDKMRAEIEQERVGYPPSADYYKAIMKCLRIIDKYNAEKGDKK